MERERERESKSLQFQQKAYSSHKKEHAE